MEWMNDFVERFQRDLQARGYSKRTSEHYQWSLQRFRQFLEEKKIESFHEVTRQLLSEYQTRLLVEESREGRPLAAGSRLQHLSKLRQFFRYLVKHGHLLVNPAEILALPRMVKSPPPRVLTPIQVRQLLLVPDVTDALGLRNRTILEVLYATGIRAAELVGLDLGDIDMEAQELHVLRGKGGKSRSVPIGAPACLWIRRYLESSRPVLLRKPSVKAFFLSWTGQRLHKVNLGVMLRDAGRKAEIPFKVTAHAFRHAFATHLIQRQASLRHVQEMLGHKKISSTQIYTHLDLSDLKETHGRCHPRGRRGVS